MERREGDAHLLVALLNIRNWLVFGLEKDGFRPGGGICYLLGQNPPPAHARHYCWGRLYNLFRKWPAFSGEEDYPVPSDIADQHPSVAFEDNSRGGSLWLGAYGALRMQLLEWMISELEEKVNG